MKKNLAVILALVLVVSLLAPATALATASDTYKVTFTLTGPKADTTIDTAVKEYNYVAGSQTLATLFANYGADALVHDDVNDIYAKFKGTDLDGTLSGFITTAKAGSDGDWGTFLDTYLADPAQKPALVDRTAQLYTLEGSTYTFNYLTYTLTVDLAIDTFIPSGDTPTTVTIPVSGDEESVDLKVEVKGDTATIKEADVDEVLEAEEVGTVTIDVSSLDDNVTEVIIPNELLTKIADAVADPDNDADSLEVKLPNGTVTFDAEALAAIAEQAGSDDLRLNLELVSENSLTAAQQEAIEEMDVQLILDAYMTANGKRISDFEGGSAAVTVVIPLKEGQVGAGIRVFYVADDGAMTEVPTTYNNKEARFVVEHFSNYVVTYDAEKIEACPKDDTCPISAYTDAVPTAWYHDGVHFVIDAGIMQGFGNGIFKPNGTTTRAQAAMILWNMEGKPAATGETIDFADVEAGAWYADAIAWASSVGVVNGWTDSATGKQVFSPATDVTREQFAAMLYRYAQLKGDGFTGLWAFQLDFPDAGNVASWATEAMSWMVMKGVINGMDGKLNPQGNATRAQVANMIYRFVFAIA